MAGIEQRASAPARKDFRRLISLARRARFGRRRKEEQVPLPEVVKAVSRQSIEIKIVATNPSDKNVISQAIADNPDIDAYEPNPDEPTKSE